MKRVIVVHGWKGKPTSNWSPWLKGELEVRGVSVQLPQMPNPSLPKKDEWMACLQAVVGEPDHETYFVGHSLGGIAILRYLDGLPAEKRIAGIVFVAAFSETIHRSENTSFFLHPVNYQKVRGMVTRGMVAIQSTNDPYVPFRHGEVLRDKLGAKLIPIQNGGHLNAASGYITLPIVLNELIAMGC